MCRLNLTLKVLSLALLLGLFGCAPAFYEGALLPQPAPQGQVPPNLAQPTYFEPVSKGPWEARLEPGGHQAFIGVPNLLRLSGPLDSLEVEGNSCVVSPIPDSPGLYTLWTDVPGIVVGVVLRRQGQSWGFDYQSVNIPNPQVYWGLAEGDSLTWAEFQKAEALSLVFNPPLPVRCLCESWEAVLFPAGVDTLYRFRQNKSEFFGAAIKTQLKNLNRPPTRGLLKITELNLHCPGDLPQGRQLRDLKSYILKP